MTPDTTAAERLRQELREILALLDDQKLLLFEIHAEVKARLQKLVGETK